MQEAEEGEGGGTSGGDRKRGGGKKVNLTPIFNFFVGKPKSWKSQAENAKNSLFLVS